MAAPVSLLGIGLLCLLAMSASAQYPSSPSSPDSYPSPGSPDSYPSPGSPDSYGSPGSPDSYPSPGSPDSYGSPDSPGSYPSPGSPGSYPSPGSPGSPDSYGSPGSPDSYPSPGSPDSYGSPDSPDSYPSPGSPDSYGSPDSPDSYPSPGSSGSYPCQGSPGSYPSPGSPGSPNSYPSPSSYPSPGSPGGYKEEGELIPPRNVTCKDTDGKRPGCTSTCPDRCPQQCTVLCPNCRTFCQDEVKPAKPVPPPAMFVFGDGALDVGNNAYLPKVETEEGYYPQVSPSCSGRFSNGANLADTIATSMGFQESPPAYMSLGGGLNMWGANYASAAAGIRISTNGERSISLPKQLEHFKATRAQMEAKLGSDAKVRDLLSKSVFLLGIGTQDLDPMVNVQDPNAWEHTEVQELIAQYGEAVTSLYDMGARKMAIVNVRFSGRTYYHICSKCGVENVIAFDDALKTLMAGLATKKSGLSYSIGDFYGFTTAVFANPANYGLVNTRDSCSQFDYTGWTYCYNPDGYWFWDPEFMTDRAAKLTAAAFYYGPPEFTSPITFKTLLEKK